MDEQIVYVWGYAPVGVGVVVADGVAKRIGPVVVLDEDLQLPESVATGLVVANPGLPTPAAGLAVGDEGYGPVGDEVARVAIAAARGNDFEWPAWQFGW